MTTLRTVVIDDEPLAQELLASYIEKTPYMTLVGKYSSAQDAIKTILEDKIDVLFLDIHMPQLNGMEFARIVPSHCSIVFTTAYDRKHPYVPGKGRKNIRSPSAWPEIPICLCGREAASKAPA